jgi:hypothetical protein
MGLNCVRTRHVLQTAPVLNITAIISPMFVIRRVFYEHLKRAELEKDENARNGRRQVFLVVDTIPYVKPGTSSTELKLWD